MRTQVLQLFLSLAIFAAIHSPAVLADPPDTESEIAKYNKLIDEAIDGRDLEAASKQQAKFVEKITEWNKEKPDDLTRGLAVLEGDLLTLLKAATKLSKEKRDELFTVFEGMIAAKKLAAEFKNVEQIDVLLKTLGRYNKQLAADEMQYLEYSLHGMLGRAYLNIGELEKSIESFARVQEIRIKRHGESHPDFHDECAKLSECKIYLGDLASAELYCRDYLERGFCMPNDYGIKYASGLSVLAMIHLNNNRIVEAEAFSILAIAMTQKSTDKSTFVAARSYLALAEVYMLRGKQTEAKEYYKKCLRIYKEVAGENSFHFAEAGKKYAVLLKVMGEGEEAQRITNEANEMIKFYKDKLRDLSKQ